MKAVAQTPVAGTPGVQPIDVARVRRDFPILSRRVNGKPLVYLDNAATAQKPRAVIEALGRYYESQNANIHRGVHALSVEATTAYESGRSAVQRFLDAGVALSRIFRTDSGENEQGNHGPKEWKIPAAPPGNDPIADDDVIVTINEDGLLTVTQ